MANIIRRILWKICNERQRAVIDAYLRWLLRKED